MSAASETLDRLTEVAARKGKRLERTTIGGIPCYVLGMKVRPVEGGAWMPLRTAAEFVVPHLDHFHSRQCGHWALVGDMRRVPRLAAIHQGLRPCEGE